MWNGVCKWGGWGGDVLTRNADTENKLLVTLGTCCEFMRLAATLAVAAAPQHGRSFEVHHVCVASVVAMDKETRRRVPCLRKLFFFRIWSFFGVSHEILASHNNIIVSASSACLPSPLLDRTKTDLGE